MNSFFKSMFGLAKKSEIETKNLQMPELGSNFSEVPHNDHNFSNNLSFARLAHEAYCNNVIANRCINLISASVSQMDFKLKQLIGSDWQEVKKTDNLCKTLRTPGAAMCFEEIISDLICYYLIAGESYLLALRGPSGQIIGVKNIRPDLVKIKKNARSVNMCYVIDGENPLNIKINPLTGACDLFVFKSFHPLTDDSGISQIEVAAASVIQHNLASQWNQNLLKNSARPSGALVLKEGGFLTDSQFRNLKEQIDECFSGVRNSGRPLLLEGGMQWKDIGFSPKDMDFLEAKNMAAREIALSLGVPPQLLGIPGDNKFSNYNEARLSFWKDTIAPLALKFSGKFSSWLSATTGRQLILEVDVKNLPLGD